MKRTSNARLALLWLVARLKLLVRTPRTTFFTIVFPLILLVLLNEFNSSTIAVPGGHVAFAQYYTPSIAIFALTAATYTFAVFGVATAREQGVLKRVRGTPLPMPVFIGSWVAANVLTGLLAVAIMFGVAVPAFGVHVRPELLPAAVVTLALGGITFSALGFAVASFVRRAETAPIVANLTLFPLLFVSGVFFSVQSQPEWLRRLADFFPLSHLVHAFGACFSPYTSGSGFSRHDLLSLAAWCVVGIVVAARRFAREALDEDSGTQRPHLGQRRLERAAS